jgi:hypothetical protein
MTLTLATGFEEIKLKLYAISAKDEESLEHEINIKTADLLMELIDQKDHLRYYYYYFHKTYVCVEFIRIMICKSK